MIEWIFSLYIGAQFVTFTFPTETDCWKLHDAIRSTLMNARPMQSDGVLLQGCRER